MKGDFSRSTFQRDKHYTGVRLQQGRVLLDSEWNEQADIAAYLDRIANVDIIGKSGVPRDGGGFELIVVTDDLIITPGRMWVEGTLCENEGGAFANAAGQGADGVKIDPWPIDASRYAKGLWLQIDGKSGANDATVYRRIKSVTPNTKIVVFTANVGLDTVKQVRPVYSYATQPHDPKPADTAPDGNGDPAVTFNFNFVAYLDVWTRHLTAVEDESIREIALGGPDTTTRTQTIWQVRLDKTAQVCADIVSPKATSLLAAQTAPVADPPNPCIVPSQAGYRGLANQLYRVEIHTGTTPGPATFKWSRDNGAFVFPIEGPVTGQPLQLRLESLGRDERFGLTANDWVELLDERMELQGLPGLFARVKTTPQLSNRILELDNLPPGTDFENNSPVDLARNPRVRLWSYDRDAPPPSKGDVAVAAGPINLESGIQVLFSGSNYRSGEYWLIPARTAINEETGDIEWPRFGNKPIPLPPRGITHSHAALLDFSFADGKTEDCRPFFSPLTAPELFYLGGDGQEAMPDLVTKNRVQLAYPLRVGVLNGGPIANAEVEFEIIDGEGRLANAQKIFKVITGANGVAQTTWEVDATMPHQRCRATLLKANGYAPVPLPSIDFNASISIAAQVAYDPAKCAELKNRNVKTVQDALDAFCDILDDPKLHFVGGDGQETTRKSASPSELPETIDVGVADGIRPVGNAKVRFTPSDNGTINGVAGMVEVNTAAVTGLASVNWALDSAGPGSQTARAELIVNGNPAGLPVIFKAMFREVAQGGTGPCSIVIAEGEDVQARIAEVAGDPDVEICFTTGKFQVNGTIVISDKNSVKITGGGRGTLIRSASDGTVFNFQKCGSVILRDLNIEPGNPSVEFGDVMTVLFQDCGEVACDTLRVKSAAAPPDFFGAALWFVQTGRFSVEQCELIAFERQIGIVFDEPEQATITDNDIGGAPIRLVLVSKLRVMKADDGRPPGNFVMELGNQRLTANVPAELVDELRGAMARANNPRINNERAALAAFNDTLSTLIFDPASRQQFRELDRTIRRLAAEGGRAFAAILARHQKFGTPIASGSLTIRDNRMHDTRNGFVGGESRGPVGGDRIERLSMSGNEISFNEDTTSGSPTHGIFVPECESLHVYGNHIEAEQSGLFGIRMDGILGPFAVLRDNHILRCKTGISGTNLGTLTNRTWWAIANNTTTITLPEGFQRDKNIPVP